MEGLRDDASLTESMTYFLSPPESKQCRYKTVCCWFVSKTYAEGKLSSSFYGNKMYPQALLFFSNTDRRWSPVNVFGENIKEKWKKKHGHKMRLTNSDLKAGVNLNAVFAPLNMG